ncbi:hypothetical protein A2U01_0006674 [Trifolium medium]|uniref:Uncharacterized protein n=1 Tax=Trifolium medium TaxID=97028 RepID=A0A392MF67_9FABA|nr:hypothetical protein [Trifolium medium]
MGAGVRQGSEVNTLARLWKSKGHLKLLVFSWQLLHDRIPTCHNLFKLQVLVDPDGLGFKEDIHCTLLSKEYPREANTLKRL